MPKKKTKQNQMYIPDNDVEGSIAGDITVPRNTLRRWGQRTLSFRYHARITHV